jgi:hypothetical protein
MLIAPNVEPSVELNAATRPELLVTITALLSLVTAMPASGTPRFLVIAVPPAVSMTVTVPAASATNSLGYVWLIARPVGAPAVSVIDVAVVAEDANTETLPPPVDFVLAT